MRTKSKFFNHSGFYIKKEENLAGEMCWFFGFQGGEYGNVISKSSKKAFIKKMEAALKLMKKDV